MTPEEMDARMGCNPVEVLPDGVRVYETQDELGGVLTTKMHPDGKRVMTSRHTLHVAPDVLGAMIAREAIRTDAVARASRQVNAQEEPDQERHPKPIAFWFACASAVLLFCALFADLPYEYFVLLRFVVCVSSAAVALWALRKRVEWLAWAQGALAVLFNPFVKIHLGRDLWSIVDIVAGFFMLATARVIWRDLSRQD